MNRPPEPPPYGALIEAAREAAGLSRREAARRAGISDAWWRYVVQGWQNGPISGPADTVAEMARVVGVTPEQLEAEGQRADAAKALREILSAAPAPSLPRNPFAGVADPAAEPEGDEAWDMFPDPADRVFRWIWRMPLPMEERARTVSDLRAARRAAQDPPGRHAAGLPAVPARNDPGADVNSR